MKNNYIIIKVYTPFPAIQPSHHICIFVKVSSNCLKPVLINSWQYWNPKEFFGVVRTVKWNTDIQVCDWQRSVLFFCFNTHTLIIWYLFSSLELCYVPSMVQSAFTENVSWSIAFHWLIKCITEWSELLTE